MKQFFYESPVGKLCIVQKDNKISHILYNKNLDCEVCETSLIKSAARQIGEYFRGVRKIFDIPLLLEGTEFQKKVWTALLTIPYGETAAYGDIAKMIGYPKASRAVGGANNKNKIPIIIPCHRVIGSDGGLVGYAGGLEIKKYLLALEGRFPD